MNKNHEHQFEKKDVLAFIIALYRIIIPQLFLMGIVFVLVIYLVLCFWFNR